MSDYREDESVMEAKLKRMMYQSRMHRSSMDEIKLRANEFKGEIEGFFQEVIYNEERLGDALRTARALRSMSQQELSFVSNVNQTYICKIEGGQTNISVALLANICEALNMRLSELFFLLEESSSKTDVLPAFHFDEKMHLFQKLMMSNPDLL